MTGTDPKKNTIFCKILFVTKNNSPKKKKTKDFDDLCVENQTQILIAQ